jgi:mannonate dehydratase
MAPKLGMGLYGDPDLTNGFNDANLQFARQLGCTHVTLHLPGPKLCPNEDGIWKVADLIKCREQAAVHGLVLFAIENFEPQHWYKVLLGLPGKEVQMENLKTIVRNLGAAGIPCMGYLFALTGVYGHTTVGVRGGAQSVSVLEDHVPNPRGLGQEDGQTLRRGNGDLGLPLPKGEVWDRIVDVEAFASGEPQSATEAEMWERFAYYLHELVPVAEEAGVRLAAHPDDPPVPVLRGVSKLIYVGAILTTLCSSCISSDRCCDI